MTPEERKRVLELVSEIQVEHNHTRFIALVTELNELLKRKELRIVAATHGCPAVKQGDEA